MPWLRRLAWPVGPPRSQLVSAIEGVEFPVLTRVVGGGVGGFGGVLLVVLVCRADAGMVSRAAGVVERCVDLRLNRRGVWLAWS